MPVYNLADVITKAEALVWSSGRWGEQATKIAWSFYRWCKHERTRLAPSSLQYPKMHQITTDDLDEWVKTLGDVSPATVNRHLAVVSKLFTVARQRGYTGPVPYMPRQKEPPHKLRYLTRAEEVWLGTELANQDLYAKRMMTVLVDTGLRLGELERLVPSDLNWDNQTLTVREAKGGRPRTIPMTARVQAVLWPWSKLDPKRRPSLALPSFRKHWNTARKRMGLMEDKAFTPHVLRHTCASRLVQAGVPLKVIQEWLGHSDLSMTLRYAHLAPENLQHALRALEEYNADVKGN